MAGMSSVVLRMGRLQSETSAPATSRREARRIPPRPTRARPTCPSYLPPGRRAKSSRYPPNLKCRMAGVLPRPSCRLGILAAGRSCFLWQLLGYPRRLAVVPRPLRRSVRNDGANRTGVQYNKPQKSRRSRWPRFAKLPRPDDGAAVSTVAKLGYDECVGLEIWSVSAGRFAAVSAMWREVQKKGAGRWRKNG